MNATALSSTSRRSLLTSLFTLGFCAFAGGCAELPDVQTECCGNGVLEATEECDSHTPGCLLPDGGLCVAFDPAGKNCRFACDRSDGGLTCPSGYVCGRDQVCRQPAGSYAIAPPVGTPGETFQVRDVNHDGVPDLVGTTIHELTVYLNDGAGNFTRAASGPAEVEPYSPILGGLRLSSGDPVLTLLDPVQAGANLYSIGRDAQLHPVVAPAFAVDESRGAIHVLGSLPGAARVLTWQSGANALGTVAVDPTTGALTKTSIDISACGPAPASIPEAAIATLNGSTTVALLSQNYLCVLPGLAAPVALDLSGFRHPALLHRPMLADLAKQGRLSVMAVEETNADEQQAYLWQWTSDPKGHFSVAAPADPKNPNAPFAYNLLDAVLADLNRDGFPDLVTFEFYVLNDGFGHFSSDLSTAHVISAGLLDYNASEIFVYQVAVGDVNADGNPDLVLGTNREGAVATCISGGEPDGPTFTCQQVPTPLPTIDAIAIADTNGDDIPDAVVASFAEASDPTQPAGGLALLLGQGLTFPDASPISLPLLSGKIESLGAAAPGAGTTANLLVVSDRVGAGSGALSLAVGVPSNQEPRFPILAVGGFSDALVIDLPTAAISSPSTPSLLGLEFTNAVVMDQFPTDGVGGLLPTVKKIPVAADLDSGAFFVPLPSGLPGVIYFGASGNLQSYFLAVPGSDGTSLTSFFINDTIHPAPGPTIQFNGTPVVQDLDGDGIPEVIIVDAANSIASPADYDCNVFVTHLHPNGAAPTTVVAASVPHCSSDDVGIPKLFFADANHDGLLDLFFYVSPSPGVNAIDYFPGKPDGTFDTTAGAMVTNPYFVGENDGSVAQFNSSGDFFWAGTADLDGDGQPDVVWSAPLGAVIAFSRDTKPGPRPFP